MIAVRPAEERDLDALAEIAAEVITGHWTRASIAEELNRAIAEVLVAEEESEALGFAVAWSVADEASILLIAVRARAQRKGIGRALLERVVAGARSRGARELHLEVRAGNHNARAFYRAHGFEESGVRKKYYAVGGEDAVLMRRPLI